MQDGSGEALARGLAARRQQVQGLCAVCGKRFVGLRTRKYCSQTCNVAAYRSRHRAEWNAWQRQYYRRRKRQEKDGSGQDNPKGDS